MTIEDLTAAGEDGSSFYTFMSPVTVTGAYCTYQGTGSTPATIDLRDGEDNAMTMTDATCTDVDSAARPTIQAVTAANALVAGESIEFVVTNTVAPETDKYTICVIYKYTVQ